MDVQIVLKNGGKPDILGGIFFVNERHFVDGWLCIKQQVVVKQYIFIDIVIMKKIQIMKYRSVSLQPVWLIKQYSNIQTCKTVKIQRSILKDDF